MTSETVFKVEQEVYSGPFDLLLKAIEDEEVDIYHVSLTNIISSFFKYWRQESPGLILASDFLITAAYMLEIKSKSLLPVRAELLPEDELSNIEESLVSHIQEYEIFKGLAQTLHQRKELFAKVFARHEGESVEKEIELTDVSLKDLVLAFRRVYAQAAKRDQVVEIKDEEITLEERIEEIKKMIIEQPQGVPFVSIFIRQTRLEIIVTFLAVLELAKQKFIRIIQGGRFDSIHLIAAEKDKEET